jgi:hypothetical protein
MNAAAQMISIKENLVSLFGKNESQLGLPGYYLPRA